VRLSMLVESELQTKVEMRQVDDGGNAKWQ
jgi:hypothetical protein